MSACHGFFIKCYKGFYNKKNKYSEKFFRIVTGSSVREHDKKHIKENLSKNTTLTDVTDDLACLGVFGPKSRELLTNVFGDHFLNLISFLLQNQALHLRYYDFSIPFQIIDKCMQFYCIHCQQYLGQDCHQSLNLF